MGVLDNVVKEAKQKVSSFYGHELPECATEFMLSVNELCTKNLKELTDVDKCNSQNHAWMKRILHWEVLSELIVNCKPENLYLVEDILRTFKSPKKWEIYSHVHEGDAIEGECEYAKFGKLVAEECGIRFVDVSGEERWLVEREARM